MEIKITNITEHPLLFRTEIKAVGIADSFTPSKVEIHKLIADVLKCDEKIVVINNIKTTFGTRKIIVTAYKYKDEDSLKKIAPKKKEKKEKPAKAKKTEKKE